MSEKDESKVVGLDEIEATINKAVSEAASPDKIGEVIKGILAEDAKVRKAEHKAPMSDEEKLELSGKYFKAVRDHARGKAVDDDSVFKIDSDSGAIVTPPVVSADIIMRAVQESVALPRVRTFPQNVPSISHVVDATDDGVDYPNETETKPATAVSLSLRTWTLKLASKLIAVSNQILDQANINTGDYINGLFGQSFGLAADRAIFQGVAGVYTSVPSDAATKQYIGSTVATGLTYDVIVQMMELSAVLTQGAEIFVNPKVLGVIRRIRDNEGRPIFNDPVAGLRGMILDYPYVLTDAMPTVAEAQAADLPILLFGNLRNVWIGNDYGLKITTSKEASFLANVNGVETLVSAFQRNLTLFLGEYSRSIQTARPEAFSAVFTGSEPS